MALAAPYPRRESALFVGAVYIVDTIYSTAVDLLMLSVIRSCNTRSRPLWYERIALVLEND